MKWGKIRVVPAMLVAVALVFSCKEPPPVNPAKGVSLSSASTTVEFGAASASVTIAAHVDWTLSVTQGGEWITPDITSGKANSSQRVTFTIAPNGGETTRTGKVSIEAAGEKDPYLFSITQNAKNTLTGVNAWIHEQLSGWYYWNDVVKATAPPSNTLAYDKFLAATITALPWADVQDRSNGESPATIDGEYKMDQSGNMVNPPTRDHIYSYIERTGPTTRAGEGEGKTFGFDVTPFLFGDEGQVIFLVNMVRPESPAANAGLKRGMWIHKYDGANITEGNYMNFLYRLLLFEGGDTMSITDEDGNAYDLTAVEMKLSPILYSETITTGGGSKVAYLAYNEFEWGAKQPDGTYEFENDLRKVFGEFKADGATKLVLDLRYNGGGYVHTCQVLTSLIGNVGVGDIFAKTLRNDDINEAWKAAGYSGTIANPQIDYFFNEPNSLNLSKVYVLATRNTASASEMVINALRGADIDVVHIGARTNGKNVGMDLLETTIGEYSYEMRPITFKILNAKDFTDYANGFVPKYSSDELYDVKAGNPGATGIIYELGDPNERLLKVALDLIDGNTVTSGASAGTMRTAAGGTMQPLAMPQGIRRQGGAIYVHDKDE